MLLVLIRIRTTTLVVFVRSVDVEFRLRGCGLRVPKDGHRSADERLFRCPSEGRGRQLIYHLAILLETLFALRLAQGDILCALLVERIGRCRLGRREDRTNGPLPREGSRFLSVDL